MPNRDFDAMAKAEFEAITLTIGGKQYTMGKIGARQLDQLTNLPKDAPLTMVCGTLAQLLGAKEDAFLETDIRTVMAAIQFIADEVTKQFSAPAGNPSEAEAT